MAGLACLFLTAGAGRDDSGAAAVSPEPGDYALRALAVGGGGRTSAPALVRFRIGRPGA